MPRWARQGRGSPGGLHPLRVTSSANNGDHLTFTRDFARRNQRMEQRPIDASARVKQQYAREIPFRSLK
jgi:hypothetical protein